MITVIRIEHPADGWGIFRINHSENLEGIKSNHIPELTELYERHNDKLKTPYEDGLNMSLRGHEWYCAYKGIEQIKRWITPEEFKTLYYNGYKILLLDVTNYQEGKDQVVYTKTSVISMKDISELFI